MRLVTRGNLDGLACAVLIDHAERLESVELTIPNALVDGSFEVRSGDILVNLPHDARCHRWFDHHSITRGYETPPVQFDGRYGLAPSTARLVYDYYLFDSPGLKLYEDLVEETDRFDNAQLSIGDVMDPEGYVLIGFTLEPSSGFEGRDAYFETLLDTLRDGTLDEVLELPCVRDRADALAREQASYLDEMKQLCRLEDRVIVTDLREDRELPAGHRYLIYTLFPEATTSLRIGWGPNREFVTASAAHNPFNRVSTVHLGGLMSKFGGGGDQRAGASTLDIDSADEAIKDMVAKLNAQPVTATP